MGNDPSYKNYDNRYKKCKVLFSSGLDEESVVYQEQQSDFYYKKWRTLLIYCVAYIAFKYLSYTFILRNDEKNTTNLL